MQFQGEICSRCGTNVGPYGCCSDIRKLSRTIAEAARIARESREILRQFLVKTGISSQEINSVIDKLRELT